jgi:hypothetical protein
VPGCGFVAEPGDARAASHEGGAQMAADESVGAGDEHSRVRESAMF